MTLPPSPELLRRLRAPGYLILGVAAILPLLELGLTTWPPRLGMVAWRFGTEGLLATAMNVVLIMLLLLYALALVAGDRKVVLALGIIAALFGAVLLLATGSFVLDFLQMRARVRPDRVTAFLAISIQALVKLVIQCVASVVVAVSAIRTWRMLRPVRREVPRGARPASTLVVGPTAATPPARPRAVESSSAR